MIHGTLSQKEVAHDDGERREKEKKGERGKGRREKGGWWRRRKRRRLRTGFQVVNQSLYPHRRVIHIVVPVLYKSGVLTKDQHALVHSLEHPWVSHQHVSSLG